MLNYSGEEDVMRSAKTSLQAMAAVRGCVGLWARGSEHLLGELRLETKSFSEMDWECSLNYSDEEDAMRSVMLSCQPLALVRGCVGLWAPGTETKS